MQQREIRYKVVILRTLFYAIVFFLLMPLSSLYAEIKVMSPADYSYTEKSLITVIGAEDRDDEKSEVKISVKGTVNGLPEELNEVADIYDREFNLEIELYEGENVITVDQVKLNVFYVTKAAPPPQPYGKFSYHTALKTGCSYCHDMRASGLPLVSEKSKSCNACHPQYTSDDTKDLKESVDKKFQSGKEPIPENFHKTAFEDKCLQCHQPHSSPNRKLLAKEQVFFMCEDCHEKIFNALSKAKGIHPPQKKGECVRCHSPHAYERKYLFKDPLTDICFNCHKSFLKDSNGNAKKSIHEPAKLGLCFECHDLHFGDELELTNIEDIEKNCARCHEGKSTDKHIKNKKACISCHFPHSSDFDQLLRNDKIGDCKKCHDDVMKGKTVHEAMEKPCTYCHGSLHDFKDIDIVKKNCYEKCHQEKEHIYVAHNDLDIPLGKCTSCHNPHSSDGETLIDSEQHMPFFEGDCLACHYDSDGEIVLKNEGSALCYQCHDSKEVFKDTLLLQNMHTPVRLGKCADCHDPHASKNKKLLFSPENEICIKCHSNKIYSRGFKKYDVLHAPMTKEGCYACHETHGSVNSNNLKYDAKTICFNCHKDLLNRTKNAKVVHPPYDEKKCIDCHDPHGTDFNNLLIGNQSAICYKCHKHLTKDDMNIPYSTIHKPVIEGECSKCHDPHVADDKDLLIAKGNSLCLTCHEKLTGHHPLKYESKKKDVVIVKGFLKDGNEFSCLGCHYPHSSHYKKLLPSTKEQFCKNCHKEK